MMDTKRPASKREGRRLLAGNWVLRAVIAHSVAVWEFATFHASSLVAASEFLSWDLVRNARWSRIARDLTALLVLL